jgi:antitoxin (DNA-binding transcriptional repressor) of toxin-antitoxin stability system
MNGEPILVTLKGEPVAMVVPPPPRETSSVWMTEFRNSGKIVGDIIAPAAEESEWEVLGRQGSIRLP